jgi:hypothetical protein
MSKNKSYCLTKGYHVTESQFVGFFHLLFEAHAPSCIYTYNSVSSMLNVRHYLTQFLEATDDRIRLTLSMLAQRCTNVFR